MTSGDLEQISGHYESGRLFVAPAACRKILEHHSTDCSALRQLALIALRSGDPTTAADAMTQAILIRPDDGEFHNILGNAQRKLGALANAIRSFQRATELSPRSAEAFNNLGACLQEQGNVNAAIGCFQRVLELEPFLPAAHYNLGNLQQLTGQLDEAIASYLQALQSDPHHVESHTNLGAALFQQRRLSEAILHYRRALELQPNNPEALNNLRAAYHEQNELAFAVDCFHRALELDASYWEARVNLGDAVRDQQQHFLAADAYRVVLAMHPELHDVRHKLGTVLNQLGQFDAAEDCYRQLAQRLPESAAPLNNLGVVLHLQGRLPEAIACYERARQLSVNNSESSINLATALHEQGDFTRSVAEYQRAVNLSENLAHAHRGLGDVLCDQRNLAEARRHYDQAIESSPEDAENHLHCALGLLRMGHFENGWREFEWRWRTKQYRIPTLPIPRWNGEPVEGHSILIHGEQGLGDNLQFVRYLELVKQRGGGVVFACPNRLLGLLKKVPFVDQLVPFGSSVSDCDFQAPLLSLPAIFGTTVESIPARIPYLFAEQSLVDQWSEKLAGYPGKKIGVCWQGNPAYRRDRFRSIPRRYIEALVELPDVTIFGLQQETESRTRSGDVAHDRFVDLAPHLDQQAGPFADTTAVMKALDLVITCDTSLAHLAGALGVQVWVALEFAADWRWLLDREDSPWYPTMRLFRQSSPDDWAEVFHRIRQAFVDSLR